jgi:glycerol-3-phosphate O-acyltransferase/dihydroxyacetone phosphate acyltransferase
MSDPSKRALADPAARPVGVPSLARFLMRIFFRQVEVIGAAGIPQDTPLMVVANHGNGLIDSALLLGFLPVGPRFLAKSTLWAELMVRPFLQFAAAIPVYRRQDEGVDTSKNADTFTACHAVLHAGGTIALFPEGRSHAEPAVLPLKTGVSRIVLEAEALFAAKGRSLGSRIVPVGLTFDDRGRFRSRALILVGEPLDPTPELERYADDPRGAVLSLTDRVKEGIETVTLNFPSWEEARLLDRAVDIFSRPKADLPAEKSLGEQFRVQYTFIEGYARLRERCATEVDAVAEALRAYDELLARCGLDDAQVASEYPVSRVALFVVKSLSLLMLRGPVALLGTVIHYPTYRVVGRVAKRMTTGSADQPASYKLFSSLVFFPLTWTIVAVVVGLMADSALWGLAAAAVSPLTGIVALHHYERRSYFLRQARAYLRLHSDHPEIVELRRARVEVADAVARLTEVYRSSAP